MIVTSRPLHNQSIPDDDTFVAHFVARRVMLEALLRRLRVADDTASDVHGILIGPRGMGKTSLLRRLAIAINRDPGLAARYVPLTFREEQYNVLRLGDFWRNCGEALAEWAEANGHAALAQRLDEDLAGDSWADDAAGERFAAEMQALDRRAVLLVDNLDLILDALDRADSDENWTLRRYLQHPRGPIMIGAATKPLDHSAGREAAFYEFFQPDYLNSLDAVETEACMRALATANGANGDRVLATLDSQPERLKTLHTLTGGNPRVLALIYRLLETDETGAAMEDLALLLDQVTPYYKARIEEYSPTQRAILDGIALHWDPITIAQLSRATDIPTTTLSGQLTRMIRKDNIVEAVETSGSYSGYQLVERFFNIWYLMRHGTRRTKQKMRWLVEFLTSFYSAAELNDIARRAQMKGADRHWSPEYSEAIHQALSRCEVEKQAAKQGIATLKRQSFKLDPTVRDLIRRATAASKVKDDASALALLGQVLDHIDENPTQQTLAPPILFNRAITLRRMARAEAALADYDRLIALIEPAELEPEQDLLARALLNKSVIVGQLRGPAEERAVLDALIARFDADPERQATIVRALINRAILSGRMNDPAAAHDDYDAIAKRFGDSTDPEIADGVTQALFNKAITLFEEKRWDDAIQAFDTVRDRVETNPSDAALTFVAAAPFHQAIAYAELGEYRIAIGKFDQAIALLAGREGAEDRQRLAAALYNKAMTLWRQDDIPAAEDSYAQLLAAFETSDSPMVRPIVAHTLMDLARIADLNGDRITEMAWYDALLARFAGDDAIELQQHVATAMVNRALVLDEQTDKAPVIAAYGDVLARFGDAEDPILREAAASAMVNRAIALGEAERFDEAFAAFDALVERFGRHAEPSLRRDAAQGLYNKAIVYHLTGDGAGERATYRAVLDLFGDDPAPDLDGPVIDTALQLGVEFEKDGAPEEAIALYRRVLGRFVDRREPPHHDNLTELRLRLANLLLDTATDNARADAMLRMVEAQDVEVGRNARAWLALLHDDLDKAAALAESLEETEGMRRPLLDAAIELTRGNFGLASERARIAMEGLINEQRVLFSDDYIRLLRVAADSGFGDRMLAWFEETSFADRLAPLFVAFRAFVRGEATLRDASPEITEIAGLIFNRLTRRPIVPAQDTPATVRRGRAARRPVRTDEL